jgi:flagellar protein FlaG
MAINNVSDISKYAPRIDDSVVGSRSSPQIVKGGVNFAKEKSVLDNDVTKQVVQVEPSERKNVNSFREDEQKLTVSENNSKLAAERAAHKIDTEAVNKAIEMINQKIMLKSTNLIFEFDDLGDPPIVKVVDKDNGEVIREIPPKEMQEIAKAMGEIADSIGNASGILFNSKI